MEQRFVIGGRDACFDGLHDTVKGIGKEGIGHHAISRSVIFRSGHFCLSQPVLNYLIPVVSEIADETCMHGLDYYTYCLNLSQHIAHITAHIFLS